jgi:phage baseplate assembly protein V
MDDQVRTMIRRVTLEQVYDDEGQQRMKVRGLASETLDKVVRVQPYGFTSNPPKGSTGLLLALGGRADRSMLLGIEKDDVRPKAQAAGHVAIYDGAGQIISLVEQKVRIKGASEIKSEVGAASITHNGTSVEIAAGGTTITIDGSGVTIQGSFAASGGTFAHNGHDVGSTHLHTAVTPGPSLTGPPP